MLDFRLRDTHPIQLPIDVLSTQRQRFRGRTTLLGKLMHETCVVPCNIHHSDHDDLIVFDHKMNDVGESFDQVGAETIEGHLATDRHPVVIRSEGTRLDLRTTRLAGFDAAANETHRLHVSEQKTESIVRKSDPIARFATNPEKSQPHDLKIVDSFGWHAQSVSDGRGGK